MDRKETTKFLTDLLIQDKLSDRKYFAKEVSIDYGSIHVKRIDVMQFAPQGVTYASDIEKGSFICYEIKSCYGDVYSGNGLNFYGGEKNYIVTTMETYKKLQEDLRNGKLWNHIHEHNPESSKYFGVMVPVSRSIDLRNTDLVYEEYENPKELTDNIEKWRLHAILPCREGKRTRSTTELLFCMLRSKHSYTNKKGAEDA